MVVMSEYPKGENGGLTQWAGSIAINPAMSPSPGQQG